ncbi:hypothetical protein GOBAR_AA17368 [Gossypium barbadense]|uniref:Uncharacterized protein n=1 Tax=Gossypium barbadense TaxID=3634 RepID=A0A2P5XIY3_GOSBA|nr:hypothetical protein GOBAR_AA17368 [Gossypium barbadense]
MELCSTFHLQTVMTNYDVPGTVQFCLGGLVRQLSIPEFALQGIGSPSISETERHRKAVISISPYVTQLARHLGLLNAAA